MLQELHWLPMRKRVKYKLLLQVYKCLNGMSPCYLSDRMELYKPARNLRSNNKHLLVVNKTNRLIGDSSFMISSAILWNNLPNIVKCCVTPNSFKAALKTYLFKL